MNYLACCVSICAAVGLGACRRNASTEQATQRAQVRPEGSVVANREDQVDAAPDVVIAAPAVAAAVGLAIEGTWVDTPAYRFRLDRFRECGAASDASDESGRAKAMRDKATGYQAPEGPNGGPGGGIRMGFQVSIEAKGSEVFVSPRDITLEKGGVILDAQYPDLRPPRHCSPALPVKRLRARRMVQGFVFFRVPLGFPARHGPETLAYRPTRWGGSGRVEIGIPNCLDNCADPGSPRKQPPAVSAPDIF